MHRAHRPVQCLGNSPSTASLQAIARLLLHCCGHFFNYHRINYFPPSTRLHMKKTCLFEFVIIFSTPGQSSDQFLCPCVSGTSAELLLVRKHYSCQKSLQAERNPSMRQSRRNSHT
ncbi:uncharacterized protein TNCV_3683511 [Trichonephila clavipes]|nr:uncharacterized protein TNCV_3683511 [Trichonephila clavipes]